MYRHHNNIKYLGTIYYTTGEPQQFAKFRMIYKRARAMLALYYTRDHRDVTCNIILYNNK